MSRQIIDGVDVSKCRYYLDEDGYDTYEADFMKGACEAVAAHDSYGEFMYNFCCKGRNCYYKQLTRKEQEYEKIKKQLIAFKNVNNNLRVEITALKKKLVRKD